MRGDMYHPLWLVAVASVLPLTLCLLAADTPRNSAATAPAFGVPTETATFAAGCFWGVEATFRQAPGVLWTEVGFTGGHTKNPTYDQVCRHDTGHAEAVRVIYDPAKVSYRDLLIAFFENHDPTSEASPDVYARSQYRSAIFFHTPAQQRLADAEKERRNKSGQYATHLATEIVPAGPFYRAEEYHQQYYERRGVQPACRMGNGKRAASVPH